MPELRTRTPWEAQPRAAGPVSGTAARDMFYIWGCREKMACQLPEEVSNSKGWTFGRERKAQSSSDNF